LPESTTYNETQLLEQVAGGDERAFRKVFDEHWQNIYGVALMLTKNADLAEDMVQEIFLKIWMKREQLPTIDNFKAFLFVVARNHVFSELRKKSNEIPFTEQLIEYFQETRNNPEKQLLQKESFAMVQQAVDSLPQQQRMVYQLSRDGGLTRDEIADKLGISPNTVRNHMAKAMETIRQYLQHNASDLLLWICLIEAFL
jgi:RNA polymerase sigma-70 factor (ECF subfamily)